MGIDWQLINPDQHDYAEEFECVICKDVLDSPKECTKCKNVFCHQCIKEWLNTQAFCPFKCSSNSMIVNDVKNEFKMRYEKIEILCQKGCNDYFNLKDYVFHIIECKLTNCCNFEFCKKKAKFLFEQKEFCSYFCYIQKNKTHELFLNEKIRKINDKTNLFNISKNFIFDFDFKKSSPTFICNSKTEKVQNICNERRFDTILSNIGILGGIHKFLFIVKNPVNHFKIGVVKSFEINTEGNSFCDFPEGYGFFTKGQTRNNSKDSGMKYWKEIDILKNQIINIDMEINLGEGKIFFFTSSNYGYAFHDKELTLGPIYIAMSFHGFVDDIEIINIS